ncbi:MAG: hypothetical protein FJ272_17875 [Planctomycetes bacterium]|nr:hypothetical protein [Planctomycetota bacterium]
MKTSWIMKAVVLAAVLAVGWGTMATAQPQGQPDRQEKTRELFRQIQEIDNQLRPKRDEVLKADEGLRNMQDEVRKLQQAIGEGDRAMREAAEKKLVAKQPELAETLQKAREMREKSRELAQQARGQGEAAEAARKQLQQLGPQAQEIQRKLDAPTQKLMAEDEELRALRQEQNKRSEPMNNLMKELDERLTAKILAISPESKELIEKRKALQEEMRKLFAPPGGLTPAQMEERRKKFDDLRKMGQELDEKLNPIRQKIVAEDKEVQEMQRKVNEAQQQMQELIYKKMAQSAPDQAESIEKLKEIRKQMREMWQGGGQR